MIIQPLYKKIYNDIYSKIQDGTYSAGDLLPSEAELEELFQASRTPIRQALKQLENDGYIYRLQGKGSFVSNLSPAERWIMTTGFGSYYSKKWSNISAKTLTVKHITSEKFASLLGIHHDRKIIFLNRIRYYNKEPFVYMKHYMRPIVSIDIFKADPFFVSAAGKLIQDELNIKFSRIEEEIQAVVADEMISEHLRVEIGYPILKIQRTSYYENEPVDINIYYVKTDSWKYKVNYEEE